MARMDPPPVTAKIVCDGCGKTADIAFKTGNAPENWASVYVKTTKTQGTGTRLVESPTREFCPACAVEIEVFLTESLCTRQLAT